MYNVLAQNKKHNIPLMSFNTKAEAISYINSLEFEISDIGIYQSNINGKYYNLGIQLDYEDFKPYMGI